MTKQVNGMDTETLDRLYLEWSQFTSARTNREINATSAIEGLLSDWLDKETEIKAWNYGAEVLKALRIPTTYYP